MYLKNVIEKLRRKKENPQMNTENVTNNFSQTENESTSIKSLKNRLIDSRFSFEEIRQIVQLINDNEFETYGTEKMVVNLGGNDVELNNFEVYELMGSDIETRIKIKRGINAEEFYFQTGVTTGYRIFDSQNRLDHKVGNKVIDSKKHGIYFTIDEKELFRFLMVSCGEDFGDSVAIISLKNPDDSFLMDVAIAKGFDTKGTYRAHCFYVLSVNTLNDYEYVCHLYNIAYDKYKILICGDMYYDSLEYFSGKNMLETVRALKYLREENVKN